MFFLTNVAWPHCLLSRSANLEEKQNQHISTIGQWYVRKFITRKGFCWNLRGVHDVFFGILKTHVVQFLAKFLKTRCWVSKLFHDTSWYTIHEIILYWIMSIAFSDVAIAKIRPADVLGLFWLFLHYIMYIYIYNIILYYAILLLLFCFIMFYYAMYSAGKFLFCNVEYDIYIYNMFRCVTLYHITIFHSTLVISHHSKLQYNTSYCTIPFLSCIRL